MYRGTQVEYESAPRENFPTIRELLEVLATKISVAFDNAEMVLENSKCLESQMPTQSEPVRPTEAPPSDNELAAQVSMLINRMGMLNYMLIAINYRVTRI